MLILQQQVQSDCGTDEYDTISKVKDAYQRLITLTKIMFYNNTGSQVFTAHSQNPKSVSKQWE
ncbi:hypothetical protein BAC3_01830 [uncultured bacterium]|nr:hypothetical protein BAC3_01830 [uncultured bacterium]